MEGVAFETVFEKKEIYETEDIIQEGLFEVCKLYFSWISEEDLARYPSFYIKISPNTWNKKTNTICSWSVTAIEDENEDTATIQILNQGEVVDYIYYLFQNLYYDTKPTDENQIIMPNIPSISLQANKIHDRKYMEGIADHVTGYIIFLTKHWPILKSYSTTPDSIEN